MKSSRLILWEYQYQAEPWQSQLPTSVLATWCPTMKGGVCWVMWGAISAGQQNMVLCKLCSVRQRISCLVLSLGCNFRKFTQIKLYLCFWTSKCRQVKLSSQMYSDWCCASSYAPEIQLVWKDFSFISPLCISFSLSVFHHSSLDRHLKLFFLTEILFYQWFFPVNALYCLS